MVLTSEEKKQLNILKNLNLNDFMVIPYSYLEHIYSEYDSGSYTCNIDPYISNKLEEILDKLRPKVQDDYVAILKKDWVYFLYSQLNDKK